MKLCVRLSPLGKKIFFYLTFLSFFLNFYIFYRKKGETPNDANDRAIVEACEFLQLHLIDGEDDNEGEMKIDNKLKVVFITNDKGNRDRALDLGLESLDLRTYLNKFKEKDPHILDLLASDSSSSLLKNNMKNTEIKFTPHLSLEEISAGIRQGKYLRGGIHVKRDDYRSCYVFCHKGGKKRIVHIEGVENVNRALEGDIIALELIKKEVTEEEKEKLKNNKLNEDGTAEASYLDIEGIVQGNEDEDEDEEEDNSIQYGRVVGIIRRNNKQYSGSIDLSVVVESSAEDSDSTESNSSALFQPVDKRLPKIWITSRRLKDISDSRLLVAIDYWPVDSEYPLGHYVKILGKKGDKEVETQIVLHEYGVESEDFSPSVMACLPPQGWTITPDIEKDRTDLRGLPICSIDPPGCKDIDDALHCIRLPNGRLQVGVHIADVTHFVLPGTAIDLEAAHRSTSTYLVERRLDMLPGYLTTDLCSLTSTCDHLAFSVIWEMDDDANIYDVQFCKSIIRSVASLTYDEAQVMLDDKNTKETIPVSVKLLGKLAKILRQRRIDNGALTLASPEVRFRLDEESRDPTELKMYQLKEANALVEEWMLLANITVSKKILKHFPTLGILRRHQPPTREQFAPLVAAARINGFDIDISTSKTLADSLDRAVKEDDPFFNKLLRILSTRSMMPAQYFCSGDIPKDQWHHYGLATQVYTHFTSPIRRYADCLVHRLLAAAIGVSPLPPQNADRVKQQELCSHMNRRHRAAQYASRASSALYTTIFFSNQRVVEEAYILHIGDHSLSVLVPKYGLEDKIAYESITSLLNSTNFECNNEEFRVVFYRDNELKKRKIEDKEEKYEQIKCLELQVLQKVKVEISVEEKNGDKKILLQLVQ